MFSIEEIEQIMDDTTEAVDKQREIEAILSGQLTQEEEDDVLKELDQLIDDQPVIKSEEIPELPNVPTDNISTEDKTPQKTRPSKAKIALEAS